MEEEKEIFGRKEWSKCDKISIFGQTDAFKSTRDISSVLI